MLRWSLPLVVALAPGAPPSSSSSSFSSPSSSSSSLHAENGRADERAIARRLPPPSGFTRVVVERGSFGDFLQALPLLPPGAPVRAFDGRTLAAPWAVAVVDLDVGARDLQQCADSAVRLFAEYRRARGTEASLVFHATSGDPLPWSRFAAGERPFVDGRHVRWRSGAAASTSTASYRAWLDTVFQWAGSASLALDTGAVRGPTQPGDLFVIGGSPGHVLVVVDVARDVQDAERLLLGQGFMPAQSFHLLGWVAPDADGNVVVDSWPTPFPASSRRRFVER